MASHIIEDFQSIPVPEKNLDSDDLNVVNCVIFVKLSLPLKSQMHDFDFYLGIIYLFYL